MAEHFGSELPGRLRQAASSFEEAADPSLSLTGQRSRETGGLQQLVNYASDRLALLKLQNLRESLADVEDILHSLKREIAIRRQDGRSTKLTEQLIWEAEQERARLLGQIAGAVELPGVFGERRTAYDSFESLEKGPFERAYDERTRITQHFAQFFRPEPEYTHEDYPPVVDRARFYRAQRFEDDAPYYYSRSYEPESEEEAGQPPERPSRQPKPEKSRVQLVSAKSLEPSRSSERPGWLSVRVERKTRTPQPASELRLGEVRETSGAESARSKAKPFSLSSPSSSPRKTAGKPATSLSWLGKGPARPQAGRQPEVTAEDLPTIPDDEELLLEDQEILDVDWGDEDLELSELEDLELGDIDLEALDLEALELEREVELPGELEDDFELEGDFEAEESPDLLFDEDEAELVDDELAEPFLDDLDLELEEDLEIGQSDVLDDEALELPSEEEFLEEDGELDDVDLAGLNLDDLDLEALQAELGEEEDVILDEADLDLEALGLDELDLGLEDELAPYSEEEAPLEMGPAPVAAEEEAPLEMGPAPVAAEEEVPLEMGPAPVATEEEAPLEMGPAPVATEEEAPLEMGPAPVAAEEEAPLEMGPAPVAAEEEAPLEMGPAPVATEEEAPLEMSPAPVAPEEEEAPIEMGPAPVATDEEVPLEMGPAPVATDEEAPLEMGPAPVATEEEAPLEMGPAPVATEEEAPLEMGPAPVATEEEAPLEMGPAPVATEEEAPLEMGPAPVATEEEAPLEMGPVPVAAEEEAPLEMGPAPVATDEEEAPLEMGPEPVATEEEAPLEMGPAPAAAEEEAPLEMGPAPAATEEEAPLEMGPAPVSAEEEVPLEMGPPPVAAEEEISAMVTEPVATEEETPLEMGPAPVATEEEAPLEMGPPPVPAEEDVSAVVTEIVTDSTELPLELSPEDSIESTGFFSEQSDEVPFLPADELFASGEPLASAEIQEPLESELLTGSVEMEGGGDFFAGPAESAGSWLDEPLTESAETPDWLTSPQEEATPASATPAVESLEAAIEDVAAQEALETPPPAAVEAPLPPAPAPAPSAQERRKLVRLSCSYDTTAYIEGRPLPVKLLDISLGGGKLQGPDGFQRGQLIQVSNPLPEARTNEPVTARVVWLRPNREQEGRFDIGLQFEESPEVLGKSWVITVLNKIGMQSKVFNQRKYTRAVANLPIEIELIAKDRIAGTAIDIGLGGALLAVDRPLTPTTRFTLHMGPLGQRVDSAGNPLKDSSGRPEKPEFDKLELNCEIISSRHDEGGSGWTHSAKFTEISTTQTKLLGRYVVHLLKTGGSV